MQLLSDTGLWDRSHGRTTAGLLRLVTLIASDVTASARCVGLAAVLVAAATAGALSMPAAVLGSVAVLTAPALVGIGVAGRAASPAWRCTPAGATTLAPS